MRNAFALFFCRSHKQVSKSWTVVSQLMLPEKLATMATFSLPSSRSALSNAFEGEYVYAFDVKGPSSRRSSRGRRCCKTSRKSLGWSENRSAGIWRALMLGF